MNKYETLKEIIEKSSSIVVFTGAGISTPSGIPDFRSADGIYNQKKPISIHNNNYPRIIPNKRLNPIKKREVNGV